MSAEIDGLFSRSSQQLEKLMRYVVCLYLLRDICFFYNK